MDSERKPNRLIREKSPYLLQHAFDPVNWYPWGEEAFAAARTRDIPVFLSIGYSTCHWCHVMERESFEDEATAALLNENFVCIKVDREERPDIDRLYMTALQAMGQGGGWPMSMFLTPDRRPFYGGTYFPPEARFGHAGFSDVLRKIRSIWDNERANVAESARAITTFLGDVAMAGGKGNLPGTDVLGATFRQISSTYDGANGGFGAGPKFPRPVVLDFLLRYSARTGERSSLEMVNRTLLGMASGGMYDHLGGGFHRYSVDTAWRVPHFEKMLYDQAQLVQVYIDAWLCSREPLFLDVARETLDYVLRDMTDPGGGFYSAEDADSPRPEQPEESGEGAFYVWTKKEIDETLGGDAAFFNEVFGVEDGGNAPFDPQHEFRGRNILYRRAMPERAALRFGIGPEEGLLRLTAARKKMFALRTTRPRPLRDDKILTSWNGLMIGAFARGARLLRDPRYSAAAKAAADFVTGRLRGKGGLLRRYRQGEAAIEAQLDDYAFLVSGLLDLFEASGEGRWLEHAVLLTDEQIRLFHDDERQGFFDTSGRDSTLLVRMKEQYDGAEPAGNSVAAMNLLRLSRMVDRPEWESLARETVANFGVTLRSQPGVLPLLASALDCMLSPPRQVVVAGGLEDPRTTRLVDVLFDRYLPTTVTIPLDTGTHGDVPRGLNPFLRAMTPVEGKPAAYVCHGFACELPTSSVESLSALLEEEKGGTT